MNYKLKNAITEIEEVLRNEFGIDDAALRAKVNEWELKYGNSESRKGDMYWSILNSLLFETAKKMSVSDEFYYKQRIIYCLLGSILMAEGKNVSANTAQINKIDILRAELSEFENEIEIISTPDCNYSMQFDGIKLSYDEAVNNFPLDYSKCDRSFGCICAVGATAKRDENGRLIMKE